MDTGLAYILMGVAFVVTALIYPYVLAYARKHNIVDNPSARKLQRIPVPVMGGTAVFIGLAVAVTAAYALMPDNRLPRIMGLLTVMYAIGVWDDIKDVSAVFRFLVELVVVWMMILLLDVEINDLHGLWGVHKIPDVVSVPLSLIAGVGIMNAINMIDGVDGYCSTYGVMACAAFAVVFYGAGDMVMFALALMAIGAVIPFFFHNVFGRMSKMFLGDGGSLMLGTLLTLFVLTALSRGSACQEYDDMGLSLPAVTLAILAVPVFDTLRVMTFRMARGASPFHPDKTHLHHLFIDMNFSHLSTSAVIVAGNVIIVALLVAGWLIELSADGQVYLSVMCALLFTWCFYFLMDHEHRKNDGEGSPLWQNWCRRGKTTNLSNTALWRGIRSVVDSRFLGAGFMPDTTLREKDNITLDPRVTR